MLQVTKEMIHADSNGEHTVEMFEAILTDARNNGVGARAKVLLDINRRPYVEYLGDEYYYCIDLIRKLEEIWAQDNGVPAPPRIGETYDCRKYCIGRYQTIKDKKLLGVMEHLDVHNHYTVSYISGMVIAVTHDYFPENEVVLTVPEFQRCFTREYYY